MKNDQRRPALIPLHRTILVCLLTIILVAGCTADPSGDQDFVYIPPTPAVTRPTPTSSPTPVSSPLPTATVTCEDNLIYLQDVTIPDGTQAEPGQLMDKRWEVQNTGSCSWDGRYELRLISGETLGAETIQKLYPARSATTTILRIHFTAPSEPGVYRSAWQAHDPQGQPFGDPIFIEIAVASADAP